MQAVLEHVSQSGISTKPDHTNSNGFHDHSSNCDIYPPTALKALSLEIVVRYVFFGKDNRAKNCFSIFDDDAFDTPEVISAIGKFPFSF